MPKRLPILALMALTACQAALPPEDVAPISEDAPTHLILVEREYRLEDPRDEEFKNRIAAEAANICGSARHVVLSTRPVGTETVGEEYLYRLNEVRIACGS